MAIGIPEFASQLAALQAQFAAGDIDQAELAAGLQTLWEETENIVLLFQNMQQVIDIKADILTAWQAALGLKGVVASVSALPSEATDRDAWRIENPLDPKDGHIYARVAGVWTDIGRLTGNTGRSAYEVAVANGFEGTEEEYAQDPIDKAVLAATAADEADLVRVATDLVRTQTLEAKEATELATADAIAATEAASSVVSAADGVFDARDEAGQSAIDAAAAAAGVSAAVAQIPKLVPTIGNWRDVTLFTDGSPAAVETWDSRFFEARSGVLVEVDRAPKIVAGVPTVASFKVTDTLDAPGLLVLYPTLGPWKELYKDLNGHDVFGVKFDNSKWRVEAGVWVQEADPIKSGATGDFSALTASSATVTSLTASFLNAPGLNVAYPTIRDWSYFELDPTLRPVFVIKQDGTKWEAKGGVLVQKASDPITPGQSPTFASVTADTATVSTLIAPGVLTLYPTIKDAKEYRLDQSGRPVWLKKQDDSEWVADKGVLVQVTGSTASYRSYAYDYHTGTAFPLDANTDYLILGNGQSWRQGGKNGSSGDATVTTTAQHPGYALMFNVGVRPGGAGVTGYVDLREQDMGGSFETAMSGMADVIMTRLNTRLGFKPRIVFANACLGGQAYFDSRDPTYGLKRGTAVYAEGLRLVQRATEISKAAGRKLVVLAQMISHGEQDFTDGLSKALYQRAMDQWSAHVDEDVRAITGQTQPVRTYMTQVNRGGTSIGQPAQVALAQLAAEDRNPRIRCVGPLYQSPGGQPEDGNDGAHLKAVGYRMMGCLEGHFLVEDLFGPYEQPLRVIDAWWVSSTVARLKYSKPIAIETTNALINVTGITVGSTTYTGLGSDGGVKFTDGSGSPPTVSSIAVASGTTDTLEVTLSGAPAGKDPRLTIAGYRGSRPGGTGSGAESGARSAIRSSASFHTDGLTSTTLYHWACQEQVRLPTI